MHSINRLDWDSDFFGYEVGRFSLESSCDFDYESFILQADKFDLVYVYSKVPISAPSLVLADRKIILQKTNSFPPKQEINGDFVVRKFSPNKDDKVSLIRLGLQSGKYSRFKVDPNFTKDEYARLYSFWIEKLLQEPTAEIWVMVSSDKELIGFIALDHIDSDYIDIVLVGVDEKFRGQGLGKILMKKVLEEISNRPFQSVKVTTQLNNIPAMNLYKAFGFKIVEQSTIYHFWKK